MFYYFNTIIDSPIKLLKYFQFGSDLLSSNSAVKQIVKFANIPLQQLRGELENIFRDHNLNYAINSATDDNISYNINNGTVKTVVELNRHRHKPLEIEIIADPKINTSIDLVKRTRQGTRNNNSRFLWYGIILFGFIIYVLLTFVSILIRGIEVLTPGWTSVQRVLGVFAFTTLLVFYWIYFIPYFRKQRHKSIYTLNTQIVAVLKVKLTSIFEKETQTKVIRCWSCFKEIQLGDEFCENCGKSQA